MSLEVNGVRFVAQASYAMGYNLAIEYLADYEKTWMLDSFRALNQRVMAPQQRGLSEWLFLEVSSQLRVPQTSKHACWRAVRKALPYSRRLKGSVSACQMHGDVNCELSWSRCMQRERQSMQRLATQQWWALCQQSMRVSCAAPC